MGYARSAKFLLGTAVLALVAASAAYLVEIPTNKRGKPSAKSVKVDQAEVTIDGFHFANSDSDKLSWELTAARAEMKKDTGQARLKDLEAVFNGQDGTVLTLKADEGVFDTGTKAMGLGRRDKDVTITSNKGCTMSVRDLKWDNVRRELSTKDTVKIECQNIRIEGKGMTARSDLQEVRIENGVRTVFTQGR